MARFKINLKRPRILTDPRRVGLFEPRLTIDNTTADIVSLWLNPPETQEK